MFCDIRQAGVMELNVGNVDYNTTDLPDIHMHYVCVCMCVTVGVYVRFRGSRSDFPLGSPAFYDCPAQAGLTWGTARPCISVVGTRPRWTRYEGSARV